MRILGFDIAVRRAEKASVPVAAQSLDDTRGWLKVYECKTGAWQQDIPINIEDVTIFGPVFACMTLIASDIGKLRLIVRRKLGGIWPEVTDAVLSPMLRTPNHYQNTKQFLEYWICSLLRRGNTYALIQRDPLGRPEALYVLDPDRVTPLITVDGGLYYRLRTDNLSQLPEQIIVPKSELIHDRINTLYHPLLGISPLEAAALPAQAGNNIARHSTTFFGSMARPSGVLTAPGHIPDDTAKRLKDVWDEGFSGKNSGKVSVLGDGLKFEPLAMKATDAQLLETLKLTAEQVATVFRVPAFMIGAVPPPAVANAELLVQQYYKSCLQSLIQGVESALDVGLGLADDIWIDFDVEGGLLRLDTAARYASYEVAVRSGWLAPNEVRQRENLPPVDGGDSPYMQQQNYSLAALARRDSEGTPT